MWWGEWPGFLRLEPASATELAAVTERFLAAGRHEESYEPAVREMLLSGSQNRFGVEDITGLPWIEIDTPEDLRRAREKSVTAGLAVGAVLLMVVVAERQQGERAAELPNLAGFDADDGMVLVPIALWLGWALPLLYLAASITPLFALLFAWRCRRFLRR